MPKFILPLDTHPLGGSSLCCDCCGCCRNCEDVCIDADPQIHKEQFVITAPCLDLSQATEDAFCSGGQKQIFSGGLNSGCGPPFDVSFIVECGEDGLYRLDWTVTGPGAPPDCDEIQSDILADSVICCPLEIIWNFTILDLDCCCAGVDFRVTVLLQDHPDDPCPTDCCGETA